jgi:hypothetical protein
MFARIGIVFLFSTMPWSSWSSSRMMPLATVNFMEAPSLRPRGLFFILRDPFPSKINEEKK